MTTRHAPLLNQLPQHVRGMGLRLTYFIVVFCCSVVSFSVDAATLNDAAQFEVQFGKLLQTYWRPSVKIHGTATTVFGYAAMQRDAEQTDSPFFQTRIALENTDPSQLKTDDAIKAFWINVYNFAAIKLIVANYPVDSIRSFKISLVKYPWAQEVVKIHGVGYSLKQIEKDMLLKRFDDPRIVFAVSCAAVSCPDRIPEPFTAARLDEQLTALLHTFFANTTKGALLNRERNILTVSWIMSKDGHLFGNDATGVVNFVKPYLDAEQQLWLKGHPVQVEYFEHDWSLNDIALADR